MSQPPPKEGHSAPVIGSSWGLATPAAAPAQVDDAERYTSLGLVGRGGMGQVEAVHDARLGRDVARKLPSPELPDLALAVLAHEAIVTAALDHPGIVPVHDAGHLPDGRPFFTMRLVRGEPLTKRFSSVQSAAELPRLLRWVLEVCSALAHAHEQGVVHADLKPDNVVVGAQGGVQVVDWGLARFVDPARAEPPLGVGGGTPPWRSPEVEGGALPTPQSDVYALGLVLTEVLTRTLGADEDRWPVDLATVVRRACEPSPDARYPTAGALGDDLARWLDGRPVEAHVYTPLELLRRAVWALRWPLAGVVSLVTVAGTVALGAAVRVATERDRAVAAEQGLEGLAAQLLDDRAAADLLADLGPDAVSEASQSLALRPSPRARGVLAAFGPPALQRNDTPPTSVDCPTVMGWDARGLLCSDGSAVTALDAQGEVLWVQPVAASDFLWTQDGRHFALSENRLLAWSPHHHVPWLLRPVAGTRGLRGGGSGVYVDTLTLTELAEGGAVREPCGSTGRVGAAAVDSTDRWWAVCADGAVVRGAPGEALVAAAPPTEALEEVVALQLVPHEEHLLFGTLRGRLGRLSTTTGQLDSVLDTGLGAVRQIAVSPTGELAVAIDVKGEAMLFRPVEGVGLGRLAEEGIRQVRWTDASTLEVLTHEVTRWTTASLAPYHWQESGGISAMAAHPGSGVVAVAVGPDLVLRELVTGRLRWRSELHRRVVKEVALSASGAVLFSGAADAADGLAVAAVGTGEHRIVDDGLAGVRTLDLSEKGTLAAAPYAPRLQVWDDLGGAPRSISTRRTPLVVRWVGEALWMLDEAGTLWTGDSAPLREVARFEHAVDMAVAPHVVVVLGDELSVLDLATEAVRPLPVSGSWTALGVSSDGQRALLGGLGGEVQQLSLVDGTVAFSAQAHTERVSAVVPLPDGWLTAGWDGQVRRWRYPAD